MIPFKLVALALSSLFFLAVTATALAGFLVLTGAPKPCIDRELTPAHAPNPALQANWQDVIPRVQSGEAVALSITEEQATTLARNHLEGKNVPVEDLSIIFCPDGTAEAFGTVTVAGVRSDVLIKGTLDVGSAQPRVEVSSLKAGNLPSFVALGLLDTIWDGEDARTLPLTISILSLDIHGGEAIVVVGP